MQHFNWRTSPKLRRSTEQLRRAGWCVCSIGSRSRPGRLRVNRVIEDEQLEVVCGQKDESPLPESYLPYDEKPREYTLCDISVVLDVRTRVSDIYSNPYDQVREQLRLSIESIKERQEGELINNADYGLLKNVVPSQRVKARKGAPTPDDLDELLTKVWKEPSFFLAHPRAIAAFGKRVHATRCASADDHAVRLAVLDLAWGPADPYGQVANCRPGEIQG